MSLLRGLQHGGRMAAQSLRGLDRNALLLASESLLSCAAGVASAFGGIFFLRLNPSNALIGLTSSLPALAAMLLYVPAGLFLQRRKHLVPWVVGSLLLFRGVYLGIGLAPFVFRQNLVVAVAVLNMLSTLPNILVSVGFGPVMAEALSARNRASVITWRVTLGNGSGALLVFLAGRWLDRYGRFPLNYQLLYILCVGIGLVHAWLVSQIRVRPQEAPPAVTPNAAESKIPGLALFRQNPAFARLMVNKLVYDLGLMTAGPLLGIYYVRHLGAPDTWLGALNTLTNVGMVLGYWAWRKITPRLGENRTLWYGLPFAASFTLLAALVPNLAWILVFQVLTVLLGAGASLSLDMLYLDTLPAGHRTTAAALYTTAFSIGGVVLPLLGVALLDRMGLVPALVFCGALRLAGAAMFYLRPVRPPQPEMVAG
jgi:MFS family permease